MPFWVKIEYDRVVHCWDTPPPSGEDGWREAIEVKPPINSTRQNYTAHRFDITKTPAEIVWDVVDVSVADRKASMTANAAMEFNQVVMTQAALETNADPDSAYSPTAVTKARNKYRDKKAAIDAAVTHDDLDAL